MCKFGANYNIANGTNFSFQLESSFIFQPNLIFMKRYKILKVGWPAWAALRAGPLQAGKLTQSINSLPFKLFYGIKYVA